jgi:hypothetical protein
MTAADELTDAQYNAADAIEAVLEAAPARTWSPSEMAQRIKSTTTETASVLRWMTDHQIISATGNGAWTRYAARTR